MGIQKSFPLIFVEFEKPLHSIFLGNWGFYDILPPFPQFCHVSILFFRNQALLFRSSHPEHTSYDTVPPQYGHIVTSFL